MKNVKSIMILFLIVFLLMTLLFVGCQGDWTWVSGSNTVNSAGIYGTKGVPSDTNVPGARQDGVCWMDRSGVFWLFGGHGYDKNGNNGLLNDLWMYDGKNWTWISGGDTIDQHGEYGKQGLAAGTNMPGARRRSIGWIDDSDNLWFFGGFGNDAAGAPRFLNDLWKFDGVNWTWISGSDIPVNAVYGEKGIASNANIPGSRAASISWIDSDGNLWLFGGYAGGNLFNDLWKFDTNSLNWVWMSGSDETSQPGIYGTIGVAESDNVPGARSSSINWIDSDGNFWLFGGNGIDRKENFGKLNDLWKFNHVDQTWTWMSGSYEIEQTGNYGTQGTASSTNIPGARAEGISWGDPADRLWHFGGHAHPTYLSNSGSRNDLWKFDITNLLWIWVSGSDIVNQSGVYGTKGSGDSKNIPGARINSFSWIDLKGDLWLFGGQGRDSEGNYGSLNDLWRYEQ